jgi:general secretion pathway protein K
MIVRFGKVNFNRGIALIIVMIVIVILSVLAAGLAYSMKVETKLARNGTFETDLEWLGRSGVEFGRYVLGQQLGIPNEGAYASLNQKWAGGPGGTNELLADIHLDNNHLGNGVFSVRIIDMERKFNLASITEGNIQIFDKALELVGVDATDFATITDSYLDWIDTDERPRINGAESADYLHLNPKSPYYAKNGPVDDLGELLLIRGITPEMFWGTKRTGQPITSGRQRRRAKVNFVNPANNNSGIGVGLVDLFTPISGAGMAVNVNTAPAEVLQMIPGIDAGLAQGIIQTRGGPDRTDGDDDDTPFMNPGELINVPGMGPQVVIAIRPFLTTQSFVFEIEVDAEIGQFHRRFTALVHRRSRQDVALLYFHWK